MRRMGRSAQFLGVLLAASIITAIMALVNMSAYIDSLVADIFIFAGLGQVLNISLSQSGRMLFGPAVFSGMAAYISAVFSTALGVNPYLGALLAIVVAGLAGVIMGLALRKLKGHYFAIATIVVSLTLEILVGNWSLTGRGGGLSLPYLGSAPSAFQFASQLPFVWLSAVYALGTVLAFYWLRGSILGLRGRALRADERGLLSAGVDGTKVQVLIMGVAAMVGAVGGILQLQHLLFIDPGSAFSLESNVILTVIPLVGGVGRAWGPLAAAILLRSVQALLSNVSTSRSGLTVLLYGALIVGVITLFPEGVGVGVSGRDGPLGRLTRRLVWLGASAARILPRHVLGLTLRSKEK